MRSGVAEKERNSAQRDVGRAGHAISTSAAGGRVSSTGTPATIASSASSDGGGSAFTTALDKACSIRERSIPQHPTDQHERSHRYECSDTERGRFFSIRLTAQRECITRPLPDQPLHSAHASAHRAQHDCSPDPYSLRSLANTRTGQALTVDVVRRRLLSAPPGSEKNAIKAARYTYPHPFSRGPSGSIMGECKIPKSVIAQRK